MGRNPFQAISINKSYRNRGKALRTHRNQNLNNLPIIMNVPHILGKNKILVINLINKILPYSDKNKHANSNAEYSILNPETNSLSPSAKSKGARLVSASLDITHITSTGVNIRKYGYILYKYLKNEYLLSKQQGKNITSINATS